MVKSYEYESEVLKQLGYGSKPQDTTSTNRSAQRASRLAAVRNSTERTPRVFSDEQHHLHKRTRMPRRRRINPDLLVAAKSTLCFAIACAFLILCVNAHMREAANDRQIQKLTVGIQEAEALHENLINELAVKTNQVAIANQARHLKMVQNPSEMTVSLTYGQGKASFGPQIADAN